MKQTFIMLFIIVPALLLAHKVYNKDMETIIAEADLVMTAKIRKISVSSETCSTGYEYTLEPQRIVLGTFSAAKIFFHYSIHYWREDRGCPSVHYIVPPVPRDAAKGQTVIAVFKKNRSVPDGYWGTGIFEIAEMDSIQKQIDKRYRPDSRAGK
ncbi:MAG TPA: hypothetical protein PKN50_20065 [Spirochaetota bacterium]|nr:hypothetical protein [Spirochaetota bacterium]HPV40148.1 hypothetical protein [Spirochaetota bacterium]